MTTDRRFDLQAIKAYELGTLGVEVALRAAHESGIAARDKDLLVLAEESIAAEGRCRAEAKAVQRNGFHYQGEYLLGKADVFAWTARRLRSLVDGK